MTTSVITVLFAISAVANAFPSAESISKIPKRNPCDGINATPILYHEYYSDNCPPIHTMDNTGACPGLGPYENECASFCEVRTNFIYGTERPFDNSFCHGPFGCTITDTQTTTVTYNIGLSPEKLKALGLGVTGGFSYASATARARSYSIKLEEGNCGYFTFVPVQKDVWYFSPCAATPNLANFTFLSGTMTRTDIEWLNAGGSSPTPWCKQPYESIANFCASEARKNSDGSVDGETIFVKTNCTTREPLAPDQQDPVFQKPGVPLDRGQYDALIANWSSANPTSSAPSPPPSSTSPPPPPAPSATAPGPPDMSSAPCKACTSTLGASTCKASDGQCLIDQCKNDNDCKTCGVDCSTFG